MAGYGGLMDSNNGLDYFDGITEGWIDSSHSLVLAGARVYSETKNP